MKEVGALKSNASYQSTKFFVEAEETLKKHTNFVGEVGFCFDTAILVGCYTPQ